MLKICFEFKKVPELFTFLPSLLAALFSVKLPSKRTKCSLKQSKFLKFFCGRIPLDPSTRSRLRHSLISPHGANTHLPILNPGYGPEVAHQTGASPSFCSKKTTRSISAPVGGMGWDVNPLRGYSQN